MTKSFLTLVVVIIGLTSTKANALSRDILNSPFVAKARACVDVLAEAGRTAGFQTDRQGGLVLILNETQRPLHPLMVDMANCLDAALPKHEVVDRTPAAPTLGSKSRIWYSVVGGDGIVWCASNSLNNDLINVNTLGGSGPKRAWYAITFKCDIGDDVLGWYKPKTP